MSSSSRTRTECLAICPEVAELKFEAFSRGIVADLDENRIVLHLPWIGRPLLEVRSLDEALHMIRQA